jgi:alpha-1,2-mannosyltransferase
MAETCRAPDGSQPFSFGMSPNVLAFVVVPILALTPITALLVVPMLWRAIGSMLGWYLRKKTDGRRSHILELVEADQKKYQEENKSRRSSDVEDGWENVDADAVGTAKNGDKGEEEWDGIVGFFHPFWYVAVGPPSPPEWVLSNGSK